MSLSSVPELVAEIAAGRMVVLVDDEDRENEGDVILAAEHVSPQAINFMAMHCRGLICLTLTRECCERLKLPPMVTVNGTKHGTAFTVSIEAASGIDTGISAADRARTIQVAVARDAKASDLVQPGHVFPLQAADGGVLMRAGHTEAGCDLATMARLTPAAVICEVMNDDGTMARLPDLIAFAARHGLKIGTIADMIRHRARHESLVTRVSRRALTTPEGAFDCVAYRDRFGGAHIALTLGAWGRGDDVLVRVHEPVSVMDWIDTRNTRHSWSLPAALQKIRDAGRGALLMLNCAESADDMMALAAGIPVPPRAVEMELRTYGIGAHMLRDLGIGRMVVLGHPRRMPSMVGYDLHVAGFVAAAPGD